MVMQTIIHTRTLLLLVKGEEKCHRDKGIVNESWMLPGCVYTHAQSLLSFCGLTYC